MAGDKEDSQNSKEQKEGDEPPVDNPFANLRLEGESLGYEGIELTKYIQGREREERAATREREREKEQREREKEQRDFELKRLEIEERAAARELEQKRLDHELKMAELRNKESHEQKTCFKPKLPPFDDTTDSIDSYLFRFERYAISVGWSEEQCLNFLPAFLKGKALSAYHEIAEDDSFSYEMLKIHLLKRFECSEEGFRHKFRSARPEHGVPMTVFLNQLKHSFGRWVDLTNVKKTYDSIVDLILQEQFLTSCSANLATYLREKGKMSANEMAETAEKYRLAHMSEPMGAKPKTEVWTCASVASQTVPNQSPRRRLFDAGCFICKDLRHRAADCPRKEQANVGIACGVGGTRNDNLKFSEGDLNGNMVNILLDSGCTTVGVKRSLVKPQQYTGGVQYCKQFSGKVVELPIARVCLQSPQFSGEVDACVIDEPVADVILGNIPGANLDAFRNTTTVHDKAAVQTSSSKVCREFLVTRKPLSLVWILLSLFFSTITSVALLMLTLPLTLLAIPWMLLACILNKSTSMEIGKLSFFDVEPPWLSLVRKTRMLVGRLLRYALELQEYNFSDLPMKGLNNYDADDHSRLCADIAE